MFGTCEYLREQKSGCSLPVSVSNEPACSRNLAMYSGSLSPKPVVTRVRGTTAAFFEGGSRLEIETGTTTVVIFAFSKRKALSVARNLRGLNVPISASDPLPPPAKGALDGTVPPQAMIVRISSRWDADVRKAALLILLVLAGAAAYEAAVALEWIPVGTQPGEGARYEGFVLVFAVVATLAGVVVSLMLATRRQRSAPLRSSPPPPPHSWSCTTTPLTPTTCRASRATRTQHRFRRRRVYSVAIAGALASLLALERSGSGSWRARS